MSRDYPYFGGDGGGGYGGGGGFGGGGGSSGRNYREGDHYLPGGGGGEDHECRNCRDGGHMAYYCSEPRCRVSCNICGDILKNKGLLYMHFRYAHNLILNNNGNIVSAQEARREQYGEHSSFKASEGPCLPLVHIGDKTFKAEDDAENKIESHKNDKTIELDAEREVGETSNGVEGFNDKNTEDEVSGKRLNEEDDEGHSPKKLKLQNNLHDIVKDGRSCGDNRGNVDSDNNDNIEDVKKMNEHDGEFSGMWHNNEKNKDPTNVNSEEEDGIQSSETDVKPEEQDDLKENFENGEAVVKTEIIENTSEEMINNLSKCVDGMNYSSLTNQQDYEVKDIKWEDEDFKDPETLSNSNEDANKPALMFVCPLPACMSTLKSKRNLREHLKKVHLIAQQEERAGLVASAIRKPVFSKTEMRMITCHFPACQATLTNKRSLREHLKIVHNIAEPKKVKSEIVDKDNPLCMLTCPLADCKSTLENKPNLKQHLKKVHLIADKGERANLVRLAKVEPVDENEYITCPLCKRPYTNTQMVWRHLTYKHNMDKEAARSMVPDVKQKCDQCFKEISSYTLKSHSLLFHTFGEFNCEICGELFDLKGKLLNHKQKYHKPKPDPNIIRPNYYSPLSAPMLPCDQCGSLSRGEKGLRVHKLRFHTLRNLECKKCGEKFEIWAQFKTHRDKHKRQEGLEKKRYIPPGEFICPECGKKFEYKKTLQYHTSYHHNAQARENILAKQKIHRRNRGTFPCNHCGLLLKKTCLSNKKFQLQHEIGPELRAYYRDYINPADVDQKGDTQPSDSNQNEHPNGGPRGDNPPTDMNYRNYINPANGDLISNGGGLSAFIASKMMNQTDRDQVSEETTDRDYADQRDKDLVQEETTERD